ncbi:Ger(x)C family spore germination protein [Paenibacillus koleovorans]|uniref:Ger(x)C family spore germination protein n=1 Tax=Paenibacillus koleovorans TaxID=121608 RepID=UPI000FD71CE0|nr:Ger(x)C family spore germination protein [Paenibacillus koleovorans]
MNVRQWARLVVLLPLLLAAGCLDADPIEQLDYVKALGIDYENGKFVAYLSFPNLSRAAKNEGSADEAPALPWIAIGRGSSLNLAVGEIYRTAPKKIVWGHTSAIVLSERLLQSDKQANIFDDLNRFRELRYTNWVFATRGSFTELFSVSPTFEQSRMYTLLHNPLDNYERYSLLPPIRMHDFMNNYQNPGSLALIPSLDVTADIWKTDSEMHEMQEIEGGFAFHDQKYSGFYSAKQLEGLRWTKPRTISGSLIIGDEKGAADAVLTINHVDRDVSVTLNGEAPVKFKLDVKLIATLKEFHRPFKEDELTSLAEKVAEEQIRATYSAGVKGDADLLELSPYVYRRDPKLYMKLTANGEKTLLKPDSLEDIQVHVRLEYLGKYKYVE